MVLRFRRAGLLVSALAATTACSLTPEPVVEDDHFEHRALTAWAAIPSTDGSRLAFVLEPRVVDADSHGAFISGWRGRVAGEGLVRRAIGDDAQTVVATVPRGFHHTEYDDRDAYVFTSQQGEWVPTAPNGRPPPPSDYAHVTWLDRDSLLVRGTRSFDPPLEQPRAAFPGTIVDTPRDGTSDVVRDLQIVAHDLDNSTSRSFHHGRGFASFSCARGSSLTVAYRPENALTGTTIVDVTFDPVTHEGRAAVLEVEDYRVTAVICRSGGRHAAIVGDDKARMGKRTLVVARRDDQLVVDQDVDAGEPAALSKDGQTLLATSAGGDAALYSRGSIQELSGVHGYDVQLSRDRALLQTRDGAWFVRLDGTSPAAMLVPHAGSSSSHEAFATGRGGFVFFDSSYSIVTDEHSVARSLALDADGQLHPVVLDPAHSRPSVAYADGTRAYLLVDAKNEDIDVVTLDLASYHISLETPAAFCDLPTVREKNQCLP